MEIVNLMKSLSVSETIEENSTNLRELAAEIEGVHTDIVYGKFTNKQLIIATQYGKVGSLLKVTVDEAENGVEITSPVYSVVNCFGVENIEQQAAARFIAERLNVRKCLMLFLCLKNYESSTIKALVEVLLNVPGNVSC